MKKIVFLLSLIIALSSCSPKWVPLYQGSTLMRDVNHKYNKVEIKLNNGSLNRVEDWNNYLKPFVFKFPQSARDSIADGLTRYYTEYDKVDNVIRFEPLRRWSSIYDADSYIALQGFFSGNTPYVDIKFKYKGYSWLFINSIKIVTDNKKYTFKISNVNRFPVGGNVFEYFFIPYNENKQLIIDIINSKEPIIRFIGDEGYDDFTIPSIMIADLKAIQNAIIAIQNNQ